MANNIREILALKTVEDMENALRSFDEKVIERLKPLDELLDTNILSSDIVSIQLHMTEVESFRARVVRLLAFAAGFVQHAKDSTFLPEKSKERSELDREAFQRHIAAGFIAWQTQLEGYVDCIDSRVNLAKKLMGLEVDGFRGKGSHHV